MSKRIITISREFGAGGHTIGQKVAERLGIPFYDQEIIDRAVADTGFSPDFVREAGEYASTTHSFLFNLLLSHSVTAVPGGELSNYDKIYIAQTRTIQELAEKFKAEHGSIICREILQLSKDAPTPPTPEARTTKYYSNRPCERCVGTAARLCEELIKENKK